MENRKIIVSFYLVGGMLVWFLTRSVIQYLYLTFYQLRRVAGIAGIREVLPVVLAATTFAILLKHPKVNSFAEDVVSELKKVTWPGRTEVVRSTTVVIICILIASFILSTFDTVWGKVIGFLLKGSS